MIRYDQHWDPLPEQARPHASLLCSKLGVSMIRLSALRGQEIRALKVSHDDYHPDSNELLLTFLPK